MAKVGRPPPTACGSEAKLTEGHRADSLRAYQQALPKIPRLL
jgi:hypothetical protein